MTIDEDEENPLTEEETDEILDMMFPDRDEPDFNDDDDGVGGFMG